MRSLYRYRLSAAAAPTANPEGGAGLDFLLDVVFADYADDAGPLSSPIVGRVGQLNSTDSGGNAALSSGEYVVSGYVADDDPQLEDNASVSRAAGVASIVRAYGQTSSARFRSRFFGALLASSSTTRIDLTPDITLGTLSTSPTDFVRVVRNEGTYWFVEGILAWVDNTDTQTSASLDFSAYASYVSNYYAQLIRLADLPANNYAVFGTRDLDLCTPGTGTGTSAITTPVTGNTFDHTPDMVLHFTVTTVGTSGSTIYFRWANDNDNCWVLFLNSNGTDVRLYERTGGVGNQRAIGGSLINGDEITLTVNDDTFTCYVNDSLAWSYTSTVHISQSGGKINGLIGGYVCSDLTARTLDGVANVGSSNHPGYGLATDVLPGPLAEGDVYTREQEAIISFRIDALPSAGSASIRIRFVDEDNSLYIYWQNTGDLKLGQTVATVFTGLATASGVLSGGELITAISTSDSVIVYYDTTLAFTYSTSVFATETTGQVFSFGTGGNAAASNLLTYPLDLTTTEFTGGAISANAGLTALGAT